MNFEEIKFNDEIYSIIVYGNYTKEGVNFFTPDEFSQQLAFMHHKKGKIIQPHIHNPVKREVKYTKEVLFIRKGKLRVDFFDEATNYLESRIIQENDVILLVKGGHGFEVLEEIEMFEVKQGPYAGEGDKTKFENKINKLKFN
jgi:mannose-6-phosphate isomerase-like protein (cupin superfamily)